MYKLDPFNYLYELPEDKDKLITIAMSEVFGDKTTAAGLLGISVETLSRRVRERIKQNEQKVADIGL